MDHISSGLTFLKRVSEYENAAHDEIAYEMDGTCRTHSHQAKVKLFLFLSCILLSLSLPPLIGVHRPYVSAVTLCQ